MKAVFAVAAIGVGLTAVALMAADGIQPGLWKITTVALNNGMRMPPQTNARCLTAEQANDLAHTFSSRRHEYDVSTNPVCEVRAEVDVAARVQGTVQYGPCRGVHLFRSASLYGRWPVLWVLPM